MITRLIVAVSLFLSAAPAFGQSLVEVRLDQDLAGASYDGRVIVAISKNEEFELGDIAGSDQLFGVDVRGFAAGDAAVIDADTFGYPIRAGRDLPPGEYHAMAFLHVYETFERSDGHKVLLPMDDGEGQDWRTSPGNLKSEPVKVIIGEDAPAEIVLSEIIAPLDPPEETDFVKTFEMVSPSLSEFWGREMRLGARVLLPKGYEDDPERTYPLVIQHGHFSRSAPRGFGDLDDEGESNLFTTEWLSDDFPRFILITIQHPTPYFDDSYAVNSANHGPYGDAITYELIPAVEKAFRAVGEPSARFLTGGSTGGWEAVAAQVFYPDDYGGAWAFYPDQLDFHYYQLVDLYKDENAYVRENEWLSVPVPGARDVDGRPRYMMADENHYEEVIGTRYRGGGQWAAWNATFAPVAEDGYPAELWNPITGEINREVADYATKTFDITRHVRENWEELGPKLVGKLNVFMGRRDNFYLEQGTYLFDSMLSETKDPAYSGRFEYGENGNHGWNPWTEAEDPGGLYQEMLDAFERENADPPA